MEIFSKKYRIGGQGIPILCDLFVKFSQKNFFHLGEKLSDYLPLVPGSDEIILDMLPNMTTNLSCYTTEIDSEILSNPYRVWKREELLDLIYSSHPYDFPQGDRFNYSAHMTNCVLMAEILESTTRTPIQELSKELLRKYSLTNTYYSLEPFSDDEDVIRCHTNARGDWEESTFWNPSWAGDAAGYVSTPDDMLKFSERLVRTKKSNYNYGVASGRFCEGDFFCNEALLGYVGTTLHVPSRGIRLVLLSNYHDVNF
jgi:CubicO group peptidase (beta-lactamase class C family)